MIVLKSCFKKKQLDFLQKFLFSIKINESRYIALFMVRRPIKKLFSIDYVNTQVFSIFFNTFCPVEKCGVTPQCLYRDSLTLSVIF